MTKISVFITEPKYLEYDKAIKFMNKVNSTNGFNFIHKTNTDASLKLKLLSRFNNITWKFNNKTKETMLYVSKFPAFRYVYDNNLICFNPDIKYKEDIKKIVIEILKVFPSGFKYVMSGKHIKKGLLGDI